jgi:hypothetical protein
VQKDARSADSPGFGEMLLDSFLNRPSRSVPSGASARPDRAPGPLYSVSAGLEATAANMAAVRAWLFDARGAVGSLRAAGWRIETSVGGRSSPIRASAQDLADLWGLASAGSDSRPVDAIRSRRLPAPIVTPQPGLRAIGLDGGRAVLVPESLFARHFVLLGRTGSGKSTELVALAADDLRAGRGFTFITPTAMRLHASSTPFPRSRPTGSISSSTPRRTIREGSTRSSSTGPIPSSSPRSSSTPCATCTSRTSQRRHIARCNTSARR